MDYPDQVHRYHTLERNSEGEWLLKNIISRIRFFHLLFLYVLSNMTSAHSKNGFHHHYGEIGCRMNHTGLSNLFCRDGMQEKWDNAEKKIMRLPPSAFPELPGNIIRFLKDGGYSFPHQVPLGFSSTFPVRHHRNC